jgi:hypothetical protein
LLDIDPANQYDHARVLKLHFTPDKVHVDAVDVGHEVGIRMILA